MTAQQASPRQLWDQIREKRRNSWKDGKRVSVETIVRQLPSLLDDPEVIAELLHQEYCLQEEQGEQPNRDAFLLRFPTAAAALQTLLERHGKSSDSATGYRDTIDASAHGSTPGGLTGRGTCRLRIRAS